MTKTPRYRYTSLKRVGKFSLMNKDFNGRTRKKEIILDAYYVRSTFHSIRMTKGGSRRRGRKQLILVIAEKFLLLDANIIRIFLPIFLRFFNFIFQRKILFRFYEVITTPPACTINYLAVVKEEEGIL